MDHSRICFSAPSVYKLLSWDTILSIEDVDMLLFIRRRAWIWSNLLCAFEHDKQCWLFFAAVPWECNKLIFLFVTLVWFESGVKCIILNINIVLEKRKLWNVTSQQNARLSASHQSVYITYQVNWLKKKEKRDKNKDKKNLKNSWLEKLDCWHS